MSRQIKLRAWDGTSYHGPFTPNDIASEMTSLSGAPCFSDDLVFEQWTGLVDNAGREIYEGDIVHVLTADHANSIWYVAFLPEIAGYTLRHSSTPWARWDLSLFDDTYEDGSRDQWGAPSRTYRINPNHFAVMGNIHQHASLMPPLMTAVPPGVNHIPSS